MLSECAQETVFTQSLIKELTGEDNQAVIYEDNLGAIYLAKNQHVSGRTKHIDIRHHWLRDLQSTKQIDIRYVRSENNPADIMTMNKTKDIYQKHSDNIRSGSLACWKEDVKSDPSVTMFDKTESESQTKDLQTKAESGECHYFIIL